MGKPISESVKGLKLQNCSEDSTGSPEDMANVKLIAGNSNPALAKAISDILQIKLTPSLITRFTDGEVRVKILESVRGYDTFVLQPTCPPVNDNLMELLIVIDALRRASARSITAVIPYYGYAKQEKKTEGREPISAKLVANLITVAGADRVVIIDLHAPAIQGFFDIPVDNLQAMPILRDYFIKRGLVGDDVVVVSPDAGGVARARKLAESLGTSLAVIFKRRPEVDEVETMEVVGDVRGKRALIFDDMISTGKTIARAAEKLKALGAREIYVGATHAVFSGQAPKLLESSPINEIVVTDTIPLPPEKRFKGLVVLSVAPLLAEAIRRISHNLSVSELFS